MKTIKDFNTKKEYFNWLVLNKDTLIAQKKANTKKSDCLQYPVTIINGVEKANKPVEVPEDQLKVRVVINTTNWMDSHLDVHMPGLWKKSLRENKNIMHIREHKMEFENIISDGKQLKSYTEKYKWKDLGFKYEGETEALMFDSTITADRNPYMLRQYARGYVKNHSVGMQYVKLLLAVNDEEFAEEYEIWEKYYNDIANKEVADRYGMFWVVKEAKAVEGSAVPVGSNIATPTMDNNLEPEKSTQQEPSKDTHVNVSEELKNLKILNYG